MAQQALKVGRCDPSGEIRVAAQEDRHGAFAGREARRRVGRRRSSG